MPSSTMKIKNLSISAIKQIYALSQLNPYFLTCEMDYQFLTFINVGVVHSLRELVYENYKP